MLNYSAIPLQLTRAIFYGLSKIPEEGNGNRKGESVKCREAEKEKEEEEVVVVVERM